MSLISLSIDALGDILFYVDAIAVVRLIECGSVLLNAKIKQIRLNLKIVGKPFMKFPFSLFNFPHLDSLIIAPHKQLSFYPLRLNGQLPLPNTPVKSLSELSLSCLQSFDVLRLDNGVPILSKTCPSLKCLILLASAVFLDSGHMEAVPRSLTELCLRSRYVRPSELPISSDILKNLPPDLTRLDLVTRPLLTDPERKDYSHIVWPLHLHSLQLTLLSSVILTHLPPNIQDLWITLTKVGEEPSLPSPIGTDCFPATLTSVVVFFQTPLAFKTTTWPPSLRNCHIPLYFSSPKEADDWSLLPKSLTFIYFNHEFPNPEKVGQLLPNLTSLSGLTNAGGYHPSLLRQLPPFLVDFYSTENSVEDIPNMPVDIKKMMIKVRPASTLSQSSSDSIGASPSALPFCDMMRLPRNLQELYILKVETTAKFSRIDFECLPPNLKILTFEIESIGELEAFEAIPMSLEEITIVVSPESDSPLISNNDLLNKLPPHITSLNIVMDSICSARDHWMRSMSRFKALQIVNISLWDTDPNTDPVTLEFLATLPKSIRELDLPLDRTSIRPEHIQSLPSQLTCLSFRTVPETLSSASNECFAQLPPNLTILDLPSRGLEGMTQELFQILPLGLVRLSVPNDIERFRNEYFEREPEWGDFRPI